MNDIILLALKFNNKLKSTFLSKLHQSFNKSK